jgi:hypothetical protein
MEAALTDSTRSAEIDELLQWRNFENEQLHRRITWQGQFQSILFAALALAWKESRPLVTIIGVLGLVIAAQGIGAIHYVGISLLNIELRRREIDPNDEMRIFGFMTERKPIWRYFPSPEFFIPIAFCVAWGAVLYVKLIH